MKAVLKNCSNSQAVDEGGNSWQVKGLKLIRMMAERFLAKRMVWLRKDLEGPLMLLQRQLSLTKQSKMKQRRSLPEFLGGQPLWWLICWSCHNKTPWARGLRQRESTFQQTVLEAQPPRSRCQQLWFLQRSLSLAGRWPPDCPPMGLWCFFLFLEGQEAHWIRAWPLWSHVTLILPKSKYCLTGLGFVLGRLAGGRGQSKAVLTVCGQLATHKVSPLPRHDQTWSIPKRRVPLSPYGQSTKKGKTPSTTPKNQKPILLPWFIMQISTSISLWSFFFFFFFLATPQHMEFLGQGSDPAAMKTPLTHCARPGIEPAS